MLRSMDVTYAFTDPSAELLSWLYVSRLTLPVAELSSVLAKFGSPVLLKVTLSLLVGANPVPVQLPALLQLVSPAVPVQLKSAAWTYCALRTERAAAAISDAFRFVRTEVSFSDPGSCPQ